MIVKRDDIKMNSEKVRAIVEWEKLTHLKEIQAKKSISSRRKRYQASTNTHITHLFDIY
jgi:hypothetical protein